MISSDLSVCPSLHSRMSENRHGEGGEFRMESFATGVRVEWSLLLLEGRKTKWNRGPCCSGRARKERAAVRGPIACSYWPAFVFSEVFLNSLTNLKIIF